MPRMHGERIQDYWARQQSAAEHSRALAEVELSALDVHCSKCCAEPGDDCTSVPVAGLPIQQVRILDHCHAERHAVFNRIWQSPVDQRELRELTRIRREFGRMTLPITPACTCSEFPYPHIHSFSDTQMALYRRGVSLAKYMSVSRSPS